MAALKLKGRSWRLADWPRRRLITRNAARLWYQAATYVVASWMPRAGSRFRRSGPRHLVLLARHLPPTVNGGVYRPLALLEEAARRGWEVTAVSAEAQPWHPEAGQELARRIPATCQVVRWEEMAIDADSRHTPGEVDGGFDSVVPMVAAARNALGRRRPSLVLATGPTFAEFIAAMVLGALYRVPYVLDYRDEWSESPFEFVKKGNSDRFWEAQCLRRAALVTFTTEAQRAHQLTTFPGLSRKRTTVIGNGWDEQGGTGTSTQDVPSPGGRAVVAYVGNLGPHCDVPEFFGTVKAALAGEPTLRDRIELRFVGVKGDAEQRALAAFDPPELISDLPQVPLSAAQAAMRHSDALLLFNTPQLARYIPGKTYEYIAAGSRILLYGEGGEVDRLLGDYPAALRVRRGDARGLGVALATIARSKGGGRADPALVERYSRGRRAMEHIDALERVLRGSTETEGASPPPS